MQHRKKLNIGHVHIISFVKKNIITIRHIRISKNSSGGEKKKKEHSNGFNNQTNEKSKLCKLSYEHSVNYTRMEQKTYVKSAWMEIIGIVISTILLIGMNVIRNELTPKRSNNRSRYN